METKKEIERFPVMGDDGIPTTIVIMQTFTKISMFQRDDETVPGMKEALTLEGQPCNQINEDEFVILGDGVHPDKTVRRAK